MRAQREAQYPDVLRKMTRMFHFGHGAGSAAGRSANLPTCPEWNLEYRQHVEILNGEAVLQGMAGSVGQRPYLSRMSRRSSSVRGRRSQRIGIRRLTIHSDSSPRCGPGGGFVRAGAGRREFMGAETIQRHVNASAFGFINEDSRDDECTPITNRGQRPCPGLGASSLARDYASAYGL